MGGNVDLTGASWSKSSYSQQGGDCLEVARGSLGMVPVRDSKDPEGPVFVFSAEAWQSFVVAVRGDEFGVV
ncbi:DUF397 domain-containing protein [Kitasatospora sp. NPDC002543]